MTTYSSRSCGYKLKFQGPATIEAYDEQAGRPGAALEDACLMTIYRTTLNEWGEQFAQLLTERTGFSRENGERLKSFNSRVLENWVTDNGAKREQLQKWAQEVADKLVVDPSRAVSTLASTTSISKADLAKANEILSHDSDYIETRVNLLLGEVPDYELTRQNDGKPEPQSLARLIGSYIAAKLQL